MFVNKTAIILSDIRDIYSTGIVIIAVSKKVCRASTHITQLKQTSEAFPIASLGSCLKLLLERYFSKWANTQVWILVLKNNWLELFCLFQFQDFRFLCPNDTVFDQQNLVCTNWFEVDCTQSVQLFAHDFGLRGGGGGGGEHCSDQLFTTLKSLLIAKLYRQSF